jgi:AraC-like DNA-binding protein
VHSSLSPVRTRCHPRVYNAAVPRIATLANAPLYTRFGVPLHVVRYQSGSFDTHYHRHLELIVVNADRGSNVIAGERTTFRRGQIYRLGMFHPHRIEAKPGEQCDYFNVTFLPEALSGSGVGVTEMLQPFYETAVHPPVALDDRTYERVVSICGAIIDEIANPDRYSATIVLGEFRVLLGLVTRSAGGGERTIDPRVQRVLRIISERYADPLETRELAGLVGTSASRIAQLFREHTGTTIRAALLRRRLTEAKRLLATTDTPITAVLYEAGFNDVSYFNRSFRRDTGRTPREFRRHAG